MKTSCNTIIILHMYIITLGQASCCTDSLAPIFGQTEKKNLIKLGGAYVQ